MKLVSLEEISSVDNTVLQAIDLQTGRRLPSAQSADIAPRQPTNLLDQWGGRWSKGTDRQRVAGTAPTFSPAISPRRLVEPTTQLSATCSTPLVRTNSSPQVRAPRLARQSRPALFKPTTYTS